MRRGLLLLSALLALGLTGCSGDPGEPGLLDRALLKVSGIAADGDYQTYRELREEGRLDGQGQYRLPGEENGEGAIRVTLARNSNVQLSWFTDEGHTRAAEEVCRLEPGGGLYPVQTSAEPFYELTGVRVWVYGPDGSRSLFREFAAGEPVLIPADFTGTELSVEPFGRYLRRSVTLETYRLDGGRKLPLNREGEWYVNGRQVYGGTAQLEPADVCDVHFCWDTALYYPGRVSPEPLYTDEERGRITFQRLEQGEQADYAVELIPWAAVTVKLKTGDRLLVNGRPPEDRTGRTVKLTGLRAGDEIVVQSQSSQRPTLESGRLLRYSHTQLQDGRVEHRFEVMATDRREG